MPEAILQVVSCCVVRRRDVLFAMMFKWLPDVSVAWRDVWLGAFITALFFEVGKAAIGFYIGKQGLESTYGAAASIVVVLIWVYYTSQIILMGAEVTHAYAKHEGSISSGGRAMDAKMGGPFRNRAGLQGSARDGCCKQGAEFPKLIATMSMRKQPDGR